VEGNSNYAWVKDFLPQIQNVKLIPRNPFYEIEHSTAAKYSELVHAGRLTVAEASQQIMTDVRDGVAKMDLEA
jgi:hypothetical protein